MMCSLMIYFKKANCFNLDIKPDTKQILAKLTVTNLHPVFSYSVSSLSTKILKLILKAALFISFLFKFFSEFTL